MATRTQKTQKAQTVFNYYKRYRDDTLTYRIERDRLERIYHGLHFTPDEDDSARKRGESTVIDNRLRPLIVKRVSKLVSGKPSGKLFGVSGDDQGTLLDALSAMGDYFWDISKGQLELTHAVKDMQKIGAGYLLIYADPYADYGMGELKFRAVSYRDVFYDKGSARLSQSPRVIIRKQMDADAFLELYPQLKPRRAELLTSDDSIRFTSYGQDGRTYNIDMPNDFSTEKSFVLILEMYEKVIRDVWIYRELSTDATGALTVFDDPEIVEDEYGNPNLPLTDEQRTMIETAQALLIKAKIPRIRVTTSIGDVMLLDEPYWLPIDDYPIIELRCEDTRNGEPRGELDYLAGNQEFMSKALNLVIGNAAMGSFLRFIADPSRLTEFMTKEKFEQAISTPGGILWMMQDALTGRFPLDVLRPEPISEAFVFLMNYMASTMEYSLQQFGTTMGDPTNAPRTFAATAQIGEWADESLTIPRDEIERGIQELYDIFYQWVPSYYTSFKTFSTYDDETEEENSYQLNIPQVSEDGVRFLNNISNFRTRFRIRKGSTAASMSTSKAILFKDLLQVTQNPAFLLPMLENLPAGKYKSQLRSMLDVVPQMQQQLSDAVQQINVLKGELDRQIQQNVEMQKRIEVEKFSGKVNTELIRKQSELQKLLTEAAADLRVLVERSKSNTDSSGGIR